ncbi:hypothetical protein PGN35_025360 [Nodosilinea sp. PGN35]|uniref:hypothetical protein n=1 Tax=Nodosilinea sp. PGN35 TaxID=3020489 RepID=UPI0023B2E7AF|nr:hypothetical protein [Nodosilinea sp. TSF1-S3]MDF0367437.1 hypothetical protein [Nodosilinea sp. TSF1-S3]
MPRQKRTSKYLTLAERRNAGTQSIAKDLDLGNGITTTAYTQAIEDLRQKLHDYNESLSLVDQAANAVQDAEQVVRDFSERILLGAPPATAKTATNTKWPGVCERAIASAPPANPSWRRNAKTAAFSLWETQNERLRSATIP